MGKLQRNIIIAFRIIDVLFIKYKKHEKNQLKTISSEFKKYYMD